MIPTDLHIRIVIHIGKLFSAVGVITKGKKVKIFEIYFLFQILLGPVYVP